MSRIHPLTKSIILTLFIAGAVIGSWIFIQNKTEERQIVPQVDKNKPDAFSTKIAYRDIDPQGKVKNEFTSPELTHFPKEDSAEFKQPEFVIHNGLKENPLNSGKIQGASKSPWIITAKRAETLQGGKIVKLFGNVSIDKAADEQDPEKHMKTEALTFYPKENRLETKYPVLLQQPDATIRAKGLTADLAKDEVKFLADTQIVYKPLNPKDLSESGEKYFRTQQLIFHPKANQLETSDPVTMEQAGVIIQAVGLKADLKRDTVTLLSNTKITYTPSQTDRQKFSFPSVSKQQR